MAGEVLAVGRDVHDIRPGEKVMAVTRFGAYASHLLTERAWVRRLPQAWSFEQGAAFPVATLTAWYGLMRLGRLERGETVVITAAAGGVGQAACRLARARGARVIGAVGSGEKQAAARQAGAEEVLVSADYRIWRAVRKLTDKRGPDLIFDAVGGRSLTRGLAALPPEGRLVLYGFASMTPAGPKRSWPRLTWRYLRTASISPFDLVQHTARWPASTWSTSGTGPTSSARPSTTWTGGACSPP
ncbi:MAG: zinc-binding dehydrogenase [Acidobacteriota bacterium]|nr:zinc-binding dehydrogenase [Acidobacteriota bacterium]